MTSAANQPLVSIIVAYLNEEKFIRDAILSVGHQPYRPVELILVDDGSTDSSASLARATQINNVSVIHRTHQRPLGLSAARNTGLLAATGDFITYLDGDDILAASRLTEMIPLLTSKPDVDILIGNDELFVEPGAEIPSDVLGGRIDGRACYLPSMLYSQDVHRIVGGFDTRFKVCEDVDWLKRAVAMGLKFQTCDVLTIRRRIHGTNLSYQTERIKHYRLKSLYELRNRQRQGLSHYVDPNVGTPDAE